MDTQQILVQLCVESLSYSDVTLTVQVERADAAVLVGAERRWLATAINACAECPTARVHSAPPPRRHRRIRIRIGRVPLRIRAHVVAGPLVFAESLFARVTRLVAERPRRVVFTFAEQQLRVPLNLNSTRRQSLVFDRALESYKCTPNNYSLNKLHSSLERCTSAKSFTQNVQ